MEFCFADSGGMMEEDPNGFDARFIEAFVIAAEELSNLQHHPWLRTLVNNLPEGLVKALDPRTGCFLDMVDVSPQSYDWTLQLRPPFSCLLARI
jgi:hypothetical protein